MAGAVGMVVGAAVGTIVATAVGCGALVGGLLGCGVAWLVVVATPQPANKPLIASVSASLMGAEWLNIVDTCMFLLSFQETSWIDRRSASDVSRSLQCHWQCLTVAFDRLNNTHIT
jgi:hypothetical protein